MVGVPLCLTVSLAHCSRGTAPGVRCRAKVHANIEVQFPLTAVLISTVVACAQQNWTVLAQFLHTPGLAVRPANDGAQRSARRKSQGSVEFCWHRGEQMIHTQEILGAHVAPRMAHATSVGAGVSRRMFWGGNLATRMIRVIDVADVEGRITRTSRKDETPSKNES